MTQRRDISEQELRHELWLFTVATLVMLLIGTVSLAAVDATLFTHSPFLALRLAYVAVITAVILWVTVARSRLTVRMTTAAALIVVVPAAPMFWYIGMTQLKLGSDMDQFTRYHLTIIWVAALFPGRTWMIFGVATSFALLAVARYMLWHAAGIHPVGAAGEPWATLLTFGAACVITGYRAELGRAERRYRKARSAVAALQELASVARALRDGTNTPLQTIEVIAFIERTQPSRRATSDLLERAVRRVRRVLETMNAGDDTRWEEGDLTPDAETRLASLHAALLSDASLADLRPRRGGTRATPPPASP